MKLAQQIELRDWLGADAAHAPAGIRVGAITNRSQDARLGTVFFAIAGQSVNGLGFVPEMLKLPLAAVLYDSSDRDSVELAASLQRKTATPLLGIAQLKARQGELASRFYGEPSKHCRVLAVTGTDGKTSVTQLLAQALQNLGYNVRVIGTLGYGQPGELGADGMTTPDALHLQALLADAVNQGCDFVCIEASSHALHQGRLSHCQIEAAALTYVGRDHLDYHGSLENYQAAKQSLFQWPDLRWGCFNLDDACGQAWFDQSQPSQRLGYSLRADNATAEVRLLSSHSSVDGLEMVLQLPSGRIAIAVPLLGDFNFSNLLCVAAMLHLQGLSREQIGIALEGLQAIPGRMELYAGKADQARVIVDFAHTEQALRRALESLRPLTAGKLWCVFGCGGDRDRGKRPLMGQAAQQLADVVVLTDDNPRFEDPAQITREILQGMDQSRPIEVIHERQRAIAYCIEQAAAEDVILVAGKGHEEYQLLQQQRLPYSDRRLVQQLLGSAA